MNRREWMQWSATAAAMGLPAWEAHAQSSALKQGKPYAGQTINVLSVVAPQFSAHEARLAEFEAPKMDDAVRDSLDDFVARKKRGMEYAWY